MKDIILRGNEKNGKIRFFGSPEEVYNSGIIGDVFGVKLKKTELADGYLYDYNIIWVINWQM